MNPWLKGTSAPPSRLSIRSFPSTNSLWHL